jgi:hypothetical protein
MTVSKSNRTIEETAVIDIPIDLFLMQTIALVCAFTIEIKDTNINCSTSYPHGCLH